MMPGEPLKVLIVEDSPDDCELITMELRRGGLAVATKRADRLSDIEQAFRTGGWDAILSDYKLGAFTASDVLELYRKYAIDVPFIVISGTIGEETAVQLMKAGAHDFFLKDRLYRLGTAIEREVREAAIRREHRFASARLRESEERFRAVANAAPVMIWGASQARERDYFNTPWLAFRGRTAAEETGEGWMEGIHLDDLDRVRTLQTTAFAAQHEYSTEYRLRRADGEYRWVLERAIPRYAEGDGLRGYLGSCMDISEKKQTEEELRRAIRTRDEFLSAASHELQTPLAALTLQLEMLSRELTRANAIDEGVGARIEGANRQAMRISALVAQLLDVTKITAGQMKLAPVKVDMRALVQEVVASIRAPGDALKQAVTIDAPEPVVGHWDPVHLETVVSNLLGNAIKYGGQKPIHVSLRQTGNIARLSVSDQGIGIDPEAQARIFERFERGVSEMNFSGLGIGLWIVRQIVEAHGGVVRVESKKGAGATFSVELPLR